MLTELHTIILDIDGTLLQSSQVDVELQRASIEAVVGIVRLHCRLGDYVGKNGSFVEILGAKHFVDLLKKSDDHAVAISTGC